MKYFLFFYFIVDASKEMQGERIGVLNYSIQSIIPDLIDCMEDWKNQREIEIYIRTMSYNDSAVWMEEKPIPIEDYVWNDITAYGGKSVCSAIRLFREELSRYKINKRNVMIIPILFSGGHANDDYRKSMHELIAVPIMRRSIRIGISLGREADDELLLLFTGNNECILQAKSEGFHYISHFIRWEGDGVWQEDDWAEEASFEDVYDCKRYD